MENGYNVRKGLLAVSGVFAGIAIAVIAWNVGRAGVRPEPGVSIRAVETVTVTASPVIGTVTVASSPANVAPTKGNTSDPAPVAAPPMEGSTRSPGDQDAVVYAAEVNAVATSAAERVTPTQARNFASLLCGMRSGELSGPEHPQPFTESELIELYGGDAWATVLVVGAQNHFCMQYGR